MNTILWSKKAQKQVLRLPKEDAVNIYDRVDLLKDFPGSECGDIKFLKNHQYDYRLRVGRYRVMFNYKDSIEVVNIQQFPLSPHSLILCGVRETVFVNF